MKKILTATALGSAILLSGCSGSTASTTAAPAATESEAPPFSGPSGLELESEQEARASLEAQRLAAEAAAAEAAAAEARRIADEEARAAQQAAERAAAAAADDGHVSDGLESACADGTASIEQCFGPGADANGNGIADVNEQPPSSGEVQYDYFCNPESPAYAPEYC